MRDKKPCEFLFVIPRPDMANFLHATPEPVVEHIPRHQCLMYRGDPSRQLVDLTLLIRKKLQANYRCLYLNSEAMVAGIRSYLISSGVNVADAVREKRLILTSERSHLVHGVFEPGRMMGLLEAAHDAALKDGHAGLWASGDMAWEFGPARDFSKLVEYERKLEAFFQTHPALSGVCQYHADFLPDAVMQHGLELHPGVYVNQTLSRINPHYQPA